MHIPDGFLTPPVWGGLAAISVPSVLVIARRAQRELAESRIPLMGVMGAFVFAAQMINFPVGAGTSGHLVGGALLTAALGPAAASITLVAILVVQALLFQDGGLLALGTNIFNMALVGVFVAWGPWRAFQHTRFRAGGAFLAGFLSVLVSALLCLGELALSGTRLQPSLFLLALGVFVVTALLEGVITMMVLNALERINPGWLQPRTQAGRPVFAALAAVAVLLATAGFAVASSLPDGVERLAGLTGLDQHEITLFHAPLPDYESAAIENPWLKKAVAGLSGLSVTAGACLVLGRVLSRWRSA